MRVWSAIFFIYFCVPFAILIANEMQALPYTATPLLPKDWWMLHFDTNILIAKLTLAATGTGAISVIMWIFRQNVYAAQAIIVWLAVSFFADVFVNWMGLLPNFIANILPPELSIIRYLLLSFNTLMLFMFIVQLLSQRSVET